MIRNAAGAFEWWAELTPRPGGDGQPRREGDRAARAELRRCATIAQAMQVPATLRLFRRCGADNHFDLPAVALCAATLAHVREDKPGESVARQVGPTDPDQPETAAMKPLRFRRLLEATEPDEAMAAFRRLVALADGALNVGDLSRGLLDWLDHGRGEDRRRRWVFNYWNANPAAAPTPGAAGQSRDTAA